MTHVHPPHAGARAAPRSPRPARSPARRCSNGPRPGRRPRRGSRRRARSSRCCAGNISCSRRTTPSSQLIDAFTKATGVKVDDLARILRGRAAESLGRRQYRRRAGPVLGPLFAAASVPAEMPRRHRCRRLSRQEIRRLGAVSAVTYGKSGNKWIDIPICYSGNLMNYRISR